MGVRRCLVVLALLITAGAGLGAGRAPEDRTLNLSGPDRVAIGATAVVTMQAGGLTSDEQARAAEVTLTLPAGISYVSDQPGAVNTVDGARNSGPCAADGPAVTCTVDHPEDARDGFVSWTATVRLAGDVAPGTPLTLIATSGDLTRKLAVAPVRGSDFAVTIEAPTGVLVAGEPVTYTAVVRNLGPEAVDRFEVKGWFDGSWYIGGTIEGDGVQCYTDPGELDCEIEHALPAGGEIRLRHVLPTHADDDTYGEVGTVGVRVYDLPSAIDRSNNDASFPVRFAPRPAPSSSPATPPTATPTAAPAATPTTVAPATAAPAPGAGGGLPITGPGAAPLTLAGVLLLLAGLVTVRLSRPAHRRR